MNFSDFYSRIIACAGSSRSIFPRRNASAKLCCKFAAKFDVINNPLYFTVLFTFLRYYSTNVYRRVSYDKIRAIVLHYFFPSASSTTGKLDRRIVAIIDGLFSNYT